MAKVVIPKRKPLFNVKISHHSILAKIYSGRNSREKKDKKPHKKPTT